MEFSVVIDDIKFFNVHNFPARGVNTGGGCVNPVAFENFFFLKKMKKIALLRVF